MCHLVDVLSITGCFHVLYVLNHTFGWAKSFFWRMREHPLSVRVGIQVVSLEKEGDLNGKGFYRGTRRDSPVHGSDNGPKHPARPEHRSGSVPFERYEGEIPDRSRGFFRGGF